METEPRLPLPTVLAVEHIDLLAGGRAAVIALNRPNQLNAIDWETIRQLEAALQDVEVDHSVRAVFITGTGRAFSAGGDLYSYRTLQRDAIAFPAFLNDLHRTFRSIALMSKPVVALVNGLAVAGGLELLLSCDFAIGAQSARISDGHLTYGQMGGGGILTLLSHAVGPARARELILSGSWLSADEALEWGLFTKVVPDEALLDAGLKFATAVAERSPLAVANAKFVINKTWRDGVGIDAGLQLERERNAYYCLTSDDAQEGLSAFKEKRRPRFTGR